MNFPFIVETYGAQTPDLARETAEAVVDAAVERARAKHPDFDRFVPGIDMLSRFVFAAHSNIPLDAYIETLYCATKHGDFTKSLRDELRRDKKAK
jgi:hypothetical protein